MKSTKRGGGKRRLQKLFVSKVKQCWRSSTHNYNHLDIYWRCKTFIKEKVKNLNLNKKLFNKKCIYKKHVNDKIPLKQSILLLFLIYMYIFFCLQLHCFITWKYYYFLILISMFSVYLTSLFRMQNWSDHVTYVFLRKHINHPQWKYYFQE